MKGACPFSPRANSSCPDELDAQPGVHRGRPLSGTGMSVPILNTGRPGQGTVGFGRIEPARRTHLATLTLMSSAARVRTLGRHRPIVDPRDGDVETDEASPERRSLVAIAGNLLAEVSLPKMAAALVMLIVVPAILLGLAPIVVTIWARKLSATPGATGVGSAFFVALLLALAWYGGRSLLRVVESSFWSLN